MRVFNRRGTNLAQSRPLLRNKLNRLHTLNIRRGLNRRELKLLKILGRAWDRMDG